LFSKETNMTLILSGSDGLSDIDGSAATPAIRGTDANTGIFFGADIVGFSDGGVECARFNADAQFVAAAGTAALPVITTTGDVNTGVFFPAADTVAVSTGGTERARIDSSGNLLVGTTTATYGARLVASTTGVTASVLITDTASEYTVAGWNKATSGNNGFALFQTETSATTRGSITYNRAGGLVVYNTTSDYRSKTINGAVQNALSKVALLKPSTGRMNGATENIDFFVAHELQEVVPSAVTGEKDAVDADGNPQYQMVDKSALIPLLVAAIQEQQALITALTTRITALEAA
jgi:hypothetical protein